MCVHGTDRREGDARGMVEVATTERDDARGRGQGRVARAVVGGDTEQVRRGSARLGGGNAMVGEGWWTSVERGWRAVWLVLVGKVKRDTTKFDGPPSRGAQP